MQSNYQRHSCILDYSLDYIVEENEEEEDEDENYEDNDNNDTFKKTSSENFKLKYMMELNENLRLPQHRSSLHYYQLHYLSEPEDDDVFKEDQTLCHSTGCDGVCCCGGGDGSGLADSSSVVSRDAGHGGSLVDRFHEKGYREGRGKAMDETGYREGRGKVMDVMMNRFLSDNDTPLE